MAGVDETMMTINSGPMALEELWFPIAFDPPFRWASAWAGVRPRRAGVTLSEHGLVATFGPWTVVTPLANIVGAEISGPFSWPKVIGPPHVSLKDRGLTFAGNADAGVCIRFRRPIHGIEPVGLLRHPSLTVTVADPQGLLAALDARTPEQAVWASTAADVEDEVDRIDEESHDELESLTASELRELARAEGVEIRSSMKKSELVEAIEQHESRSDEDDAIDGFDN